MRITRLLAVLIVCRASLPAAVSAETGVTGNKIVIGSCAPLSGQYFDLGLSQVQGAKLYFDHINSEPNGIHGRKIELVSYDDAYDASNAIECFNRLIDHGIFAAAFFAGAASLTKYVPMAETHKIPLLGFSNGSRFLSDPVKRYVVTIRASMDDEARAIVDHLWNDLKMRKISVIYQLDAYGISGFEAIKDVLRTHDSAPVSQGVFERKTFDVEGAISRARQPAPEAVVVVGANPVADQVILKIQAVGWHPLIVSIGGRDSIARLIGTKADGVVVSQVIPSPDRNDLPTIELYNKLRKKSVLSDSKSYFALEGFINAMVLVEGIKRAGPNLTREKFIDAIEGMKDVNLGLGPEFRVRYGPGDHKAFNTVYFDVIHGGKNVLLTDWTKLKK